MATEQDADSKEVNKADGLDEGDLCFGDTGWDACDMVVEAGCTIVVWHMLTIIVTMGVANETVGKLFDFILLVEIVLDLQEGGVEFSA